MFFILVFSSPTFLSIGSEEVVILKNVYTDCIPIHSNTILRSFSISPDLPPGLNIDSHRSCIGGIFSGNNYGKHDFLLEGWNSYGFTKATITLYFSSHFFSVYLFVDSLEKGLLSYYYSIDSDYKDSFKALPFIPSSILHLEAKSSLPCLNFTTFDLTSPFYNFHLSSFPTLYIVFRGYLSFQSTGLYHFRTVYESDQDKVLPFFLSHS